MDSISEQRLLVVCPSLAYRIRAMAAALEKEGIEIRVVQGVRTIAEQAALYDKGRTVESDVACHHAGETLPQPIGTCTEHPLGAHVTNCPGGYSYHNFGLAVDCVPSVNGVNQSYLPDWNRSHPTWQKMIAAGEAQGLTEGATWKTFPDYPHFQLTGRFPAGEPTAELRELFKTGSWAAVWAEVQNSLAVPNSLIGLDGAQV